MKVFPCLSGIIVTWEVVNFLVGLHAGKEFRLDMIVGPAEVEGQPLGRVGLHVPLVLLGDVFHDGILGLCMGRELPLTLTTILCFLVLDWLL